MHLFAPEQWFISSKANDRSIHTQHRKRKKKTEDKSLKTQWRHSRYNCIITSEHHVIKMP